MFPFASLSWFAQAVGAAWSKDALSDDRDDSRLLIPARIREI